MKDKICKKYIKSILIPIIICFLISTILEITLFNFRYYQSRNYTPILGMPYTASDNLNMLDVGTYEIGSLEYAPYIDVDISDVQIENVFLDIWPKGDATSATRIRVHFYVADEGNIVGYDMPTNDYLRPVWQTMYTPLDLSGKCNSFRIYIDEGISEGEVIRFSTIGFNVPVPFSMSKKRILALSVILMLLCFLRPGSAIYEAKATDKFKGKKLIIASVPVFQALLMWNICNLNVACKNPQFPTQHQFEMMAEALAHGLVHLLETPPQDLIDMENPYSFQARLSTGVEEQIMYDVAYYERNYYVYFGVGPIILFYLPYFLITGSHIQTYVLVWIIGILVAGGWLFLSYELIKKYF